MFTVASEELLKAGAVGVLPTDTVYGLVARAADRRAVQRLYGLKSREHKPGTLIAADIDQLVALGIKRRYLTAVSQYWPGAVSVVIACGPELEYLHQGVSSLAIRLPAADDLRQLLMVTGPLITSSANHPGKPTSANVDEAKVCFGDAVDFYEDGGDLSNRPPSTVIRIVDDAVEVLRRGAVDVEV